VAVAQGCGHAVSYLRGLGVVPLPEPVVAVTAAERCLEQFRTYLLEERGLAERTVWADVHVAGMFLATRPASDLGLEGPRQPRSPSS
jgi:hypothetical protein